MSTSRDIRDLLEAPASSGRDAFLIGKTIREDRYRQHRGAPTLAHASYAGAGNRRSCDGGRDRSRTRTSGCRKRRTWRRGDGRRGGGGGSVSSAN
jgi:hypothetical protein